MLLYQSLPPAIEFVRLVEHLRIYAHMTCHLKSIEAIWEHGVI